METKLIRLEIENIFGVKAMDLTMNGKSAVLLGPNEAGKSSAIDALALLVGKLKDGDPVSNGKRSGYVVGEFDKFIITKEWKKGKSPVLKIEDREGNKYESGKELFDAFVDSLTFRPDEFIRMKPKDRVTALCKAIGIDLDAYNDTRKALYDERTAIGRDKKKAEGHYLSLAKPSKDTPDEEISITELNKELEEYRNKQKARDDYERQFETLADKVSYRQTQMADISSYKSEQTKALQECEDKIVDTDETLKNLPDQTEEIQRLKAEIARLESLQQQRNEFLQMKNELQRIQKSFQVNIEKADSELESVSEALGALEKEKNKLIENLKNAKNYNYEIEEVLQKLQNCERINAEVRAKKEYKKAKEEYDATSRTYDELTEKIDSLDNEIKRQLAESNLLPGLVIEDDEIYLNEVRFDRLSTFQKLDLSMKIGMKMKPVNSNGNPRLNVITMDASQFDEYNRQMAIDLAKENNYQVILEIASTEKKGHLKNANVFYVEDGTAELIEAEV